MAEHDIALKRRQIVVGDAHARELSEAGVDAIDGRALCDDPRDRGGARINRIPCGVAEFGARALIDFAPVGERNISGLDDHCPSLMRW